MIDLLKRQQIKVGRLRHKVKTCHSGSHAYFIERLKIEEEKLREMEEKDEKDD